MSALKIPQVRQRNVFLSIFTLYTLLSFDSVWVHLTAIKQFVCCVFYMFYMNTMLSLDKMSIYLLI